MGVCVCVWVGVRGEKGNTPEIMNTNIIHSLNNFFVGPNKYS